ncbi:MAG: hypothetical protein ACE5KM_07870 [Planctomycetaceae bacterium]
MTVRRRVLDLPAADRLPSPGHDNDDDRLGKQAVLFDGLRDDAGVRVGPPTGV